MTISGSQVGYLSSTSNTNAYATSSATLNAGRPCIIAVVNSLATDPPDQVSSLTTTHTGCTISSALYTYVYGASLAQKRITIFSAMATEDSAGTFTANFPANQTGCHIQAWQFAGADDSEADGSAPFRNFQTAGRTGVYVDVTMTGFYDYDTSGTWSLHGHIANETSNPEDATHPAGGIAPDAHDDRAYSSPISAVIAQWWAGQVAVARGWWATSSLGTGIACEVSVLLRDIAGSAATETDTATAGTAVGVYNIAGSAVFERQHTPSLWQQLMEDGTPMQMEDARVITMERSGIAAQGIYIAGSAANETDTASAGEAIINAIEEGKGDAVAWAFAVPVVAMYAAGNAFAETDTASAGSIFIARVVAGSAFAETDTASVGTPVSTPGDVSISGDPFAEADAVTAGTAFVALTVAGSAASEVDAVTAGTATTVIYVAGSAFGETNTASAGVARSDATVAGAAFAESDTASAGNATTARYVSGSAFAETDTATAGTAAGVYVVAGDTFAEVDTASAGIAAGPNSVVGAVAEETDTAFAGVASGTFVVAGSAFTETDTGTQGTARTTQSVAGGAFTETDTAHAGTSSGVYVVAGAPFTEADAAHQGRTVGGFTVAGSAAAETDTAYAGSARGGFIIVGHTVTEVDTPHAGTILGIYVVVGVVATETDTVHAGIAIVRVFLPTPYQVRPLYANVQRTPVGTTATSLPRHNRVVHGDAVGEDDVAHEGAPL